MGKHILILGSGMMGPAAAFNALADPEVERVVLCDREPAQLETASQKLQGPRGTDKLALEPLDLADEAAAGRLLAEADVAIAALPRAASPLAIRAALQAGTPLVDLAHPGEEDRDELRSLAGDDAPLIILGCGVEPGLTEIMSRYLAERLDRVQELHIKCGGIPEKPVPPLGYKIVFGGRQLPLTERDAGMVRDGELVDVPRYSGLEAVEFPGVGRCEAWHEGFMPWLLDLPALQGLQTGTQKTVRWPGYAVRATVLREVGLLGQEPVEVDGVPVVPKRFLDALLYSRVRMEEDDRDITVLRVDAVGQKGDRRLHLRADMVDRYDEEAGWSSMARTTAFTGAVVARMVARGDLQGRGIHTPEQLIEGALRERLLQELASLGIRFNITVGAA
ncbi:MAG: saccharopine dehydrogenase NADP-binding domain-containing protein [Chloroflexia bacterium]|nr:saccharopine dehydrogenase NADP-binding domain-containing protein [Chloroflexia bacterium]